MTANRPRAYDHHRPCACGAELADECPSCARTNPFGSMQITSERRRDRPGPPVYVVTREWWSNNHEAWLPADPDERAEHLAQLAHEREHGPAAGEEHQ